MKIQLRPRDWLIVIIPTVLTLLVAIGILLFNREMMEFKIEKAAKQYYAGMPYDIPTGAKLLRNGEGKTGLSYNGNTKEMDSLPIYFDEEDLIVLPEDMIYNNPRQKTEKYMPYFSQVSKDENTFKAIRGGSSILLDMGFIYDGEDFYLFLEPIIITLNGKEYELSAFSYASAVYEDTVMLFDYETKTFLVIEQAADEVIAKSVSEDYQISLLSDTLIFYDDTRALLVAQPSILEKIFNEE